MVLFAWLIHICCSLLDCIFWRKKSLACEACWEHSEVHRNGKKWSQKLQQKRSVNPGGGERASANGQKKSKNEKEKNPGRMERRELITILPWVNSYVWHCMSYFLAHSRSTRCPMRSVTTTSHIEFDSKKINFGLKLIHHQRGERASSLPIDFVPCFVWFRISFQLGRHQVDGDEKKTRK